MIFFSNRKKPVLELQYVLPVNLHKNDVVFVCIGSDLTIGDSLGPLVGSELEKLGYHVIGTLDKPLHGTNLKQRFKTEMPSYEKKIVIAVDACLGGKNEVGQFEVRKGPIYPGAGIGKSLMKIGDFSIAAIVSSAGPFEFFKTREIRLSFVMNMAMQIVSGVNDFFLPSSTQRLKKKELK